MKKTQPHNKAELSAVNSANSIGSFPHRKDTVTAEVLTQLLRGETLTGLDSVRKANTTRLGAFIFTLEKNYGWTIARHDVFVGTGDGRMPTITAYYLERSTIRAAFDFGALAFCRAVDSAREKQRQNASKLKREANKRNSLKAAARHDPRQFDLSY
jgi:hypothetical protein